MTTNAKTLNQALEGVIGDTLVITVTLYKSGALYSPTVTAAEFNIKTAVTDADSAALITKTLGAGTIVVSTSTVTVTVAAANWATAGIVATATYVWALKLQEAAGTITTVAGGTLEMTLTPVVAL